MPWMPEVFMAEAIRRQSLHEREEAASANDAVPYFEGIMADDPDALVRSFTARQPVLDDPRVGHVEGARGCARSSWVRRSGCASAKPWSRMSP
jgi:hypothetical protein